MLPHAGSIALGILRLGRPGAVAAGDPPCLADGPDRHDLPGIAGNLRRPETGQELFVGSLNGGPTGTFTTTYKFEAKLNAAGNREESRVDRGSLLDPAA